ncbi:family 16 glycoside hydrolase [Prosthecobacter sp.]|uniref:family 16 glycoside hydrolase n=1 Tax=Prosthecobacter sp. TaxID=1965333 RepID=UPI002ABBE62D|nr:family 16 glycoside hydrolase [Prosthecobacter sp.]MDZ4404302.1 family 16 glycoside hydrolase [Prosthecobacter sp.]
MKITVSLLLLSTAAFAADYPRVLFSDDFNAEGFGKAWGHYKSSSIVKGGVLVGITAPTSDHSAVDNIRIEGERDLQVSVKFRFVSDKAKSFNVWFDDKNYKGSHAGHICQATISPTSVNLADAKTGGFDLTGGLYERKKANQLTEDEKKMLASKAKRVPTKVSLGEWHTLVVQTEGDAIRVSIDGKDAGSFQSAGIAHDTKSLISLTTNAVDVEYDDFSIKGMAK